jgi:hypothetical protein
MKWKVNASATVSLLFEVEADDIDDAEEKAMEMAKRIKVAMNGGLVLPSGVTLGWPSVDMFDWDDVEEES